MRGGLFLGILLIVLAASNAANAGINDPEWNPPARFDHPYKGTLIIHRMPQSAVVEACANLMGIRSLQRHGCSAFPKNNRCEIWIVDKAYMGATPEAVLRHEIGHCNGWPSDHPN